MIKNKYRWIKINRQLTIVDHRSTWKVNYALTV